MKKFYQVGIVVIMAISLALSCAPYEQPQPGPGDVKSVVQKVRPGVVYIEARLASGDYVYGTGTVIDGSGYILTSNHIVEDIQSATITLADRRQYECQVVARDKDKDLALLKIAGTGMQFATVILGDSDAVEVGDELVVIGYPLGLAGDATASRGILSAFRTGNGIRYVQTDAAVSPGNSGGPLLNLDGEMIGIVTSKFTGEAVEGMALAVAANEVKPFVIAQLGGINTQGLGGEQGNGEITQPAATGEVAPRVPGVEGRIAFSDRAIYVMNADGSNRRQLTEDVGYASYWPTWSPDGERIAFRKDIYDITQHGLKENTSTIYVMNADGSNQKRLTSSWGNSWPAWSPDGKKVAFISERGGNDGPDIYVVDADGSNETRLTTRGATEKPAWSPDGKKIIWTEFGGGSYPDVFFDFYVMDANGSNQQFLARAKGWGGGPAWSPDGKRIAFSADYCIMTMNANGSWWRQLTSSGSDGLPAWSPDGKNIVFTSSRDGNAELYIMDANGKNQTRLTNTPSINETTPAWSPR